MVAKNQHLTHDPDYFVLRDGSVREDIRWISRYDPDRCLLKGHAYLIAKRIMDILLVLISLPIVIPLMLIIMWILKHEFPGRKAIYKQCRTGKGGKRFWMYKFPTMVPNADELKPLLIHLNVLEPPDFKIPEDPRVTRIGKILRRTSLDELPQFWNILKGEMSLVGPRPTSFTSDAYKIWQTERLDVLPGLTGLWQITSRGQTNFKERLMIDIAYIQHRCLLVDMIILVKTVTAVFKGKGIT